MREIIRDIVNSVIGWFGVTFTDRVSAQVKLPDDSVNQTTCPSLLENDSDDEEILDSISNSKVIKTSTTSWCEGSKDEDIIRYEASKALYDIVGDKVVAEWFVDKNSEDDESIDAWNNEYNRWNSEKIQRWLERIEEVKYEKEIDYTINEDAKAKEASIYFGTKNLWLNLTKETYETAKKHEYDNKYNVKVKLLSGDIYNVIIYNDSSIEGEFVALRIHAMYSGPSWKVPYPALSEIREELGLKEKGDYIYIDKVLKKDTVFFTGSFSSRFWEEEEASNCLCRKKEPQVSQGLITKFTEYIEHKENNKTDAQKIEEFYSDSRYLKDGNNDLPSEPMHLSTKQEIDDFFKRANERFDEKLKQNSPDTIPHNQENYERTSSRGKGDIPLDEQIKCLIRRKRRRLTKDNNAQQDFKAVFPHTRFENVDILKQNGFKSEEIC